MVWSNQGVNGRTITKGVNETSICETDFGENPDYIILEGGTNDADKFLNSPEKFGSYSSHAYVSDFDEETFCGAVESLFKRVTTDYAGAKIGFIIAQKMGTGAGGKWYNNRRFLKWPITQVLKKLCASVA
jgi:lysophospholipase L1-like esterase